MKVRAFNTLHVMDVIGKEQRSRLTIHLALRLRALYNLSVVGNGALSLNASTSEVFFDAGARKSGRKREDRLAGNGSEDISSRQIKVALSGRTGSCRSRNVP